MKLRSVTPMKIAKYGYIAISAIFTLAGLAMIFYPTPSQSFIGIFFGIAILVFGIIKLVGYWSRDLFRLAFQYDLQFGVLLCVLGIITLIRAQGRCGVPLCGLRHLHYGRQPVQDPNGAGRQGLWHPPMVGDIGAGRAHDPHRSAHHSMSRGGRTGRYGAAGYLIRV